MYRKKTVKLIITLMVLIGLTLFLIVKKPITNLGNNQELASAIINNEVQQDHHERLLFIFQREMPLPIIPKHPPSETITELRNTLDTILKHDNLSGAIAGVSVRDSKNKLIYENHGDVRLIPVSNMKIISTIAALEVLGPEYKFTTNIQVDGKIKNSILHGDLYLIGKGDPTLQASDFEALARKVSEYGITEITGSIYADDSWYDDIRYSPDLSWRHENNYIGNATSALTASANDDYLLGSVIVDVYPAKNVNEKPEVVITPETDYVTVINKGNTVAQGLPLTLTDTREHGSNELVIEGDIPINSAHYQRWRAVWEPTGYALDLFMNGLQKHGVQFSDEKVSIKSASRKARTIITKKSVPLKEIIVPFMKQSNNGLGEVLVKEIGKVAVDDGSWSAGLEVTNQVLTDLELDTADVVLRDGSGMSDNNLVSANFFTELLQVVQAKSWYPIFENSLPLAGNEDLDVGGTLSYRLVDDSTKDNVKAKTGTLGGVSTLSGYVMTKDKIKLNFAILMNNFIRLPVTHIQDEIVTVLAEAELK